VKGGFSKKTKKKLREKKYRSGGHLKGVWWSPETGFALEGKGCKKFGEFLEEGVKPLQLWFLVRWLLNLREAELISEDGVPAYGTLAVWGRGKREKFR